MSILIKIKNVFLDILFPPICLNCRNYLPETEKSNKICKKCLDSIQIHSSFFCPKCKSRIPNEIFQLAEHQQKFCHKDTNYLLISVTDYQNQAIKNIIWFLKYKKWRNLTQIITPIINRYLNYLKSDFTNFLIMPIPLHPERLKERGFNQSDLIAQILSQETNLKIYNQSLKRIKPTKSQVELKDIGARSKNIENCFQLNNPEVVKNKNIILVDDVFTTGSTINEAVKTLKKAGAKKIIAFVLAKA